MSHIEGKFKFIDDGHGDFWALQFYCPGCEDEHLITVDWTPPGKTRSRYLKQTWTLTGTLQCPTVAPSVLVRSGHYADGDRTTCYCNYSEQHPGKTTAYKCQRCHSFIREGKIQFLADCSHALAGKTVDLPDYPEEPVPATS